MIKSVSDRTHICNRDRRVRIRIKVRGHRWSAEGPSLRTGRRRAPLDEGCNRVGEGNPPVGRRVVALAQSLLFLTQCGSRPPTVTVRVQVQLRPDRR